MGAELIASAMRRRRESLICRAAGQQRSIADQSLPLVLDPRIRLILKLHLCSAQLGLDWPERAACPAPPGFASHPRLAAWQSLSCSLPNAAAPAGVVVSIYRVGHSVSASRASSDTFLGRLFCPSARPTHSRQNSGQKQRTPARRGLPNHGQPSPGQWHGRKSSCKYIPLLVFIFLIIMLFPFFELQCFLLKTKATFWLDYVCMYVSNQFCLPYNQLYAYQNLSCPSVR